MALSPADFAAYSRATGTPYPETPEERAEKALEVREFRQNQLQQPSDRQSEAAALGLGIGLGLAGLGGAGLALRRGRTIPKKDFAGKSSVKVTDLARVRQPAPGDQYRETVGFTGPERPTAAESTNLRRKPEDLYKDLVDKYPDPGVGKDFEYRPPTSYEGQDAEIVNRQDMMITDPQTGIMYPRGSSALSEKDRAALERKQRIDFINQYPDAPRKSNRPMGGPLALINDGSATAEVQASRELARRQYASSLLDEKINKLIEEIAPLAKRQEGLEMGTEASRQAAAVRRLEREEEKQAKNILSELADETPTLTETYEAFGEPAAQVQSVEAINTASDQAAAPVERVLQRNEDVDVSAAQRFLNDKRLELEAKGLSPTRVERVLGSDKALIEAAELYASTGDEAILSRFSEQPSSPLTVKPKSVLSLDADEVSTGSLFKPGKYGEFVDNLENYDVDLTNRISYLAKEQQELVGRRKQLEEDSLMIKSAMDREPAGKDAYSRMYGKMQYELQNMPDPASLNVDIGDAMAERDNVRAQLKGLKGVGPRPFLIDQTEGSRAFYQVNPATNEIIPETLEIRGGRKSIEQKKGGGGRNLAEYSAGDRITEEVRSIQEGGRLRDYDDTGAAKQVFVGDRTQTGGRVGLYGPERTGRKGERATEGQRPTQTTMDEITSQALSDSVADELGIPTPPDQDLVFTRTPRRQTQASLKASEAIRRANIEGRDPQKVLRSMGFGV